MDKQTKSNQVDSPLHKRAFEIFKDHHETILKRTDRLFAGLMVFQWIAGIVAAFVVSPRTWIGTTSFLHIHVIAAILLGGLIIIPPVVLAVTLPGAPVTRYTIASSQMLTSALLIHLTGGRIETHFHVFGSLAFLAFYRDWKVFIPATFVVGTDHLYRGLFFPESVYGVLAASAWRAIEHAAWVVFENIFLIVSCLQGVREMQQIALTQAELEQSKLNIETKVIERTKELQIAQNKLENQKKWFSTVLLSIGDGIIATNANGQIELMNHVAEELTGWTMDQAKGESLQDICKLMDEGPSEEIENPVEKILTKGDLIDSATECLLVNKSGKPIAITTIGAPIKNENGQILGAVLVFHDDTKKREDKLNLEKSLAEKNVLLQEVHHRVKNNLQNIIALLALQAEHVSDKTLYAIFNETQNRIKSIALVHQHLYQGTNFRAIEIGPYLQGLTTSILGSYDASILLAVHSNDVKLNLDRAISIGIIVNELVTNAIKYAFPDRTGGQIDIELMEIDKNNLSLIVKDDGVGTSGQIDMATSSSLGMQLISDLTKKINGTIDIDTQKGTKVTITFPIDPRSQSSDIASHRLHMAQIQ